MSSLIACRECDLLQREIVLPPGGTACCSRCGAVLHRSKPDSLDRTQPPPMPTQLQSEGALSPGVLPDISLPVLTPIKSHEDGGH